MNELELVSTARALEFRRSLGLSEHEPIQIVKVLRQCLDISLVLKPLSLGISGIFLRCDSVEIIVVNTAKSLGHQRFTAAHEYCHLRYDTGATRRICATGLFDPKYPGEREADYFAACLLLPAEGVRLRLYERRRRAAARITMEDLLDLEQYYGVSHAATLIRLRQLGLLSEEQSAVFKAGVTAAARVMGYNPRLYEPTNQDAVYSSYPAKAKRALDKGLIGPEEYERLLREANLADLLTAAEEHEPRSDA